MDGTAAISRLLEFAGVGPRESVAAVDRPTRYQCLGCESIYAVQYHVCPDCGGFSVERRAADGLERAEPGTDDDATAE
ncbi:hypothetical protein [Halobellus salinisoli]|uniref:hypothetical protein n=1 Tax=Halobellus salinisoli TaxID=3108500 RepID=UPI003009BFCE